MFVVFSTYVIALIAYKFRALHSISIFIPYFAGLFGMYIVKEHVPLRGNNCALIVHETPCVYNVSHFI